MKTLLNLRDRLKKSFTELYDACCVATAWLEEDSDLVFLRSRQGPDMRLDRERGVTAKSRAGVSTRRVA
jgi:hypothetical protein